MKIRQYPERKNRGRERERRRRITYQYKSNKKAKEEEVGGGKIDWNGTENKQNRENMKCEGQRVNCGREQTTYCM